jgi:hypothetical protein
MYKTIAAILLGFVISLPVMANEDCFLCGERGWSLSGGAGVDLNGDYSAVTISGNWLPTKRSLGTGIIMPLQFGHYDYGAEGSGERVSVAVIPVLTYHGFYAGMGLSIGNTTPNLGTVWNFASCGGWRHTFENDILIRFDACHESHAARAGLEEDKPNGGITVVGFQVGVRF